MRNLKQETLNDLDACGFSFCERHGVWYPRKPEIEKMMAEDNERLKELGERVYLARRVEPTSCPICFSEGLIYFLKMSFEQAVPDELGSIIDLDVF